MLALIIGYTLTVILAFFSLLFLIGVFRRAKHGFLATALRLYGFALCGFLALIAALLTGI